MNDRDLKLEIKHILESGANATRLLNIMKRYTELKCKETAKNVRHKACEIISSNSVDNEYEISVCDSDESSHQIMNIQFKDIAPKGVFKI